MKLQLWLAVFVLSLTAVTWALDALVSACEGKWGKLLFNAIATAGMCQVVYAVWMVIP